MSSNAFIILRIISFLHEVLTKCACLRLAWKIEESGNSFDGEIAEVLVLRVLVALLTELRDEVLVELNDGRLSLLFLHNVVQLTKELSVRLTKLYIL